MNQESTHSPESNQISSEKEETRLSLENLIMTTEGLSHVVRMAKINEEGKKQEIWQAVGSWGRGGRVMEGESIVEAVQLLAAQPYHLDHDLGRKAHISTIPTEVDLLVRAIAGEKTESELMELANIANIKYNWEVKQPIPRDESWSVYGGTSKTIYPYHANSLMDAMAKAWVFGVLGIKLLGEDQDNYYLDKYLPGLGMPSMRTDHMGHSGLETIIRKEDIHAMLNGKKEEMFQ